LATFLTSNKPSEGHFRERGSKFVAFAYHVKSESEIQELLTELRKKYYDATHHCYAWVLGNDGSKFRINDDGEPNHSAGDPILGQIRSRGLTYVLVVVVRYFGGTKLGVSRLINAYRTSASEVLNLAGTVEVRISENVRIIYSYTCTNEAMKLVDEFQLRILDQKFEQECQMLTEVDKDKLTNLKTQVRLLQKLGHEIKIR